MRFLRYLVRAFVALSFVAAVFAVLVFWRSERALAKTYDVAQLALPVTGDAGQLERGRHLVATRGCGDCHGDDLGGRVLVESPVLGAIVGSNLTSAGVLQDYTDAQLEHAIRHGVGADGKPLLYMPSEDYWSMSDDDVAAIVAYLRAQPPVERTMKPATAGPLARTLWFAGQMPLLHAENVPHDRGSIAAPVAAVTPDYGRYVAQVCTGCHGAGFSGGKVPGVPPEFPAAANLTPHESGLAAWSEDDFITALRTGKRPDGRELDAFMSWRATAQMTDVELRAMWAFLKTLPPTAAGNR